MAPIKHVIRQLFLSSLIMEVHGSLRFANHYSSNMVLQRAPYRAVIWGYRDINQTVEVTIQKQSVQPNGFEKVTVPAEYSADNQWSTKLPPIESGGPYILTATSSGSDAKREVMQLENVLFGDVWLCGGQSNMVLTMNMAFDAQRELNLAEQYSHLRLMTVDRFDSTTPLSELPEDKILQPWTVASSKSVGGAAWRYFSAICWMFGRKLYDTYEVPIGLISSCYGGSPIEAWSSPSALAECNITGSSFSDADTPASEANSALWNAMINPLLTTVIYGSIWYQGEANAAVPDKYECTFPTMVRDWRKKWNEATANETHPEFPFGFIQLATLGIPMKYSPEQAAGYPVIRWKQTAEFGYVPNSKLPNTFMAVTLDLPDNSSPYGGIHPRDKTDVADRLLLGAQNVAYGERSIQWTGPLLESWGIEKLSKKFWVIYVDFQNSTLGKNGLDIRSQTGFQILQSKDWVDVNITMWKDNRISIVLVMKPTDSVDGLRYNWSQQPCLFKACAIYANDLPAPPFVSHRPAFVRRFLFDEKNKMVLGWKTDRRV